MPSVLSVEAFASELGIDPASLNGTRASVERVMHELARARELETAPGVLTTVRAGAHRLRALGIALTMPTTQGTSK